MTRIFLHFCFGLAPCRHKSLVAEVFDVLKRTVVFMKYEEVVRHFGFALSLFTRTVKRGSEKIGADAVKER